MTESKGNEPAFPRSSQGPSGDLDMTFGLSKREWFAGMALQGMFSSERFVPVERYTGEGYVVDPQVLANNAVIFADPLLAELEKNENLPPHRRNDSLLPV